MPHDFRQRIVRRLIVVLPLLAAPLWAHADPTYGPYSDETYIECKPAKPTYQAIVLIHGNWATGSNKQANILRLCKAFAAKGIDAFDINYRMVYAAHWPAMFQDVQAAVRWVRSKGFTEVGAGGTSAGGTLSLMAGAIGDINTSPSTDPLKESTLYPGYSSKADFVVDVSGPPNIAEEDVIKGSDTIISGIPLPKTIAEATVSPITYISGSLSPTIIFQGLTDPSIPGSMFQELIRVLNVKGVTYQAQYYRAGHAFTGLPAANELACIDEAIEFAKSLTPRSNYPKCEGPAVK
jgi:acetyl esterase/lipase